jgi:hypothetical protein
MATKKKRRPVGPYVKAHQRAYAWANKAVAYRQGGKFAQAKAAAQRAQYWLCKAKLLGARAARGASAVDDSPLRRRAERIAVK